MKRREPLTLMEWDALLNRVIYHGDTKAQRQLEVDKALTMQRLADAEAALKAEPKEKP